MLDTRKDSYREASSRSDQKPAIRLTGVRKEYRLYNSLQDQVLDVLGLGALRFWRPVQFKTFSALDGVDLEIGHGERVGLIGRNGAGKTTLLKLITGNFAATAGEVEVDGEVQALMQAGRGFHGEFTGIENIKASLVYNGLTSDELEAAVEDVIEFCELGDFLYQPVKTYSLGMRARLQFATATAIKPDIVIIDEVLGAGDAYFAGKSSVRIQRLTDSGATLLIVSHSMSQILQFSQKAIWLNQGRIISSGKSLDIVNQYEEFIHGLEQKHQAKHPASARGGGGNMKEVPAWILAKSDTGCGKGADWGGNGPPRITKISVVGADGEAASSFDAGEPIAFVADIVSDVAGEFPCSCLFVLYGEAGEVIARVVEQERIYRFDGSPMRVFAGLKNNPIGAGKYILSAGLYRGYNLQTPAASHRYHILSRGYEFLVVSPARDNSRVLLEPTWSCCAAGSQGADLLSSDDPRKRWQEQNA